MNWLGICRLIRWMDVVSVSSVEKKHLPCEKAIQQTIYPCSYSTNTQPTKLWAHHPQCFFFHPAPPNKNKDLLQQPKKKSSKSPQPTNRSAASPTRKTPIPQRLWIPGPRGKVRKANLRGRRLEEWFIHGNHRVDLNQKKRGGRGWKCGFSLEVGWVSRLISIQFGMVGFGRWLLSCQWKYAAQKIFEKRLNFNSSVGMTFQ